jgi:ABC-type bacteriocin/lantibiotic exporter with double-glycine peptidase domain
MLGLSDAAENIGFRTKGYRLIWEELRDEVPFPCIVHWRQRHFVVVYDIKKKRGRDIVCVADPAIGLLQYSKEEFLKCWLSSDFDGQRIGTALLLETPLHSIPATRRKLKRSLPSGTCSATFVRTKNTSSSLGWPCSPEHDQHDLPLFDPGYCRLRD